MKKMDQIIADYNSLNFESFMSEDEKWFFDTHGYIIVKNVLSKSLGSNNQLSVVSATMQGLTQLRTAVQISEIRGETVNAPSFTISASSLSVEATSTE